jgi:ribosome-interacting GTPase 1
LMRGADLVLLVVDLGADEGIDQLQEVLDRLNAGKTRIAKESSLDEEDLGVSYTQTLLLLNKVDAPGAQERMALLDEMIPLDLERFLISAETGQGLDALRERIFRSLDVVRVYTKSPSKKEADYDKPYTIRRGGTLLEVAEMIHRDLAKNFKHARVWSTSLQGVSTMKGDYVVHDKDVVEIHVN